MAVDKGQRRTGPANEQNRGLRPCRVDRDRVQRHPGALGDLGAMAMAIAGRDRQVASVQGGSRAQGNNPVAMRAAGGNAAALEHDSATVLRVRAK